MGQITVVDDSPEFLDLMREVIADLGHQMTGFEAVHTSIEQIVETHPDLLKVDLRLEDRPQEISGWKLLVLARSHRKLVQVPVILATADLWELKQRAQDLEQIADVHVRTKPFDMDEMCVLIQRLLKAGKRGRSSAAQRTVGTAAAQ